MDEIEIKKKEAEKLIAELLTFRVTPRRELEINSRMDRICPDPYWDSHMDEQFVPDGGTDIAKIVERIFAYTPIQLSDRSDEAPD